MSHRYVPVAPFEPFEQDAAGLRLVCLSSRRTSDHLPDPLAPTIATSMAPTTG